MSQCWTVYLLFFLKRTLGFLDRKPIYASHCRHSTSITQGWTQYLCFYSNQHDCATNCQNDCGKHHQLTPRYPSDKWKHAMLLWWWTSALEFLSRHWFVHLHSPLMAVMAAGGTFVRHHEQWKCRFMYSVGSALRTFSTIWYFYLHNLYPAQFSSPS